ncbi:hypothetical protein KAR91_10340 [Candidatus Pacearchaeota archaeon]|nr:hypothetical protein [Candidatus Pacearchaeota archaeon]
MAFPKWYNVNQDIRTWSGHAESAQHQGWIFAPAGILVLEEYKGSYRFEECKPSPDAPGGKCESAPSPGYPQTWVRIEDVSTDPYEPPPEPPDDDDPDPIPDIISNEEAGEALRTIVDFILMLIRE